MFSSVSEAVWVDPQAEDQLEALSVALSKELAKHREDRGARASRSITYKHGLHMFTLNLSCFIHLYRSICSIQSLYTPTCTD